MEVNYKDPLCLNREAVTDYEFIIFDYGEGSTEFEQRTRLRNTGKGYNYYSNDKTKL